MINKLFIILIGACLLSSQLFAKENEDSYEFNVELSAECEPLTCVANCVNVCSGNFFQTDTDIVGNTIDPISLVRYYDSGSTADTFLGAKFGCQFQLFAFHDEKNEQSVQTLITERDGFFIPYSRWV